MLNCTTAVSGRLIGIVTSKHLLKYGYTIRRIIERKIRRDKYIEV